jgi:hypothetical protein
MDRSEASRDRINGSEIVWTVRAPRNKTRIQFQLTEESPLFFYSTSWFLIFSDFFTPTKVQLPLDFSGRSRKKKKQAALVGAKTFAMQLLETREI